MYMMIGCDIGLTATSDHLPLGVSGASAQTQSSPNSGASLLEMRSSAAVRANATTWLSSRASAIFDLNAGAKTVAHCTPGRIARRLSETEFWGCNLVSHSPSPK